MESFLAGWSMWNYTLEVQLHGGEYADTTRASATGWLGVPSVVIDQEQSRPE